MMKPIKVVHIPFSKRNPYQWLLADQLIKSGIQTKGASVSSSWNISFLNLSMLSAVMKYWKPDILHLHWQSSFIHVEGSRLKTHIKSVIFILQLVSLKILGIKLVWTVHNLRKHEDTFRNLEICYTKKLAKFSDHIIAHCETARKEIQQELDLKSGRKISVIPHGNFLTYYPNNENRAIAREKLGLDQTKITFLFLGELRHYKGVLDLVEDFKTLNNTDCQLIIAGRPHDHDIRHEIIKRTGKHPSILTRLHFVPDTDVQTYANASDVMVYPYRNIFTSGGIFMAMSFGKAIIAPKMGCITDTLSGSGNILFNPLEKNGLIKAMQKAIDESAKLQKIGNKNLNSAAMYGWNEIAQKTLKVYNDLI